LEYIVPKLRKHGADAEVGVVFVDMRYGVKDENTLDHMTWISCYEEIRHCYEESDGMFFMSLQGSKYGYIPLPKYVDQILFDERFETWPEETQNIATQYYTLDHSALPPRYALKKLETLNDHKFWGEALPLLIEGLKDLPVDPAAWGCEDLFVGSSVTELETKCAL
jgi:hypothetical protein